MFHITVPDGLMDFDYDSFGILRRYDGQNDILETNYNDEERSLVFSTNKFSAFSILYKKKIPNAPDSGGQSLDRGASPNPFAMILVLSGVSIFCFKKFKEEIKKWG